jgi:molybdopterin converting factor small subunit
MIAVRLPAVLTNLFPGAPRSVEMDVTTVRDMVDELNHRWPGMRDRICDTRPAIRKHMNVFMDGRRLRLDDKVEPGTEVFILTAISGG